MWHRAAAPEPELVQADVRVSRPDLSAAASHHSLGARFRWWWVLVNLLGFGLGGLVFGAVSRARSQQYFEVVTSAAEAVRIQAVNTGESLALYGALVGAVQWLALRRTPVTWWWIPATALGWSAGRRRVGRRLRTHVRLRVHDRAGSFARRDRSRGGRGGSPGRRPPRRSPVAGPASTRPGRQPLARHQRARPCPGIRLRVPRGALGPGRRRDLADSLRLSVRQSARVSGRGDRRRVWLGDRAKHGPHALQPARARSRPRPSTGRGRSGPAPRRPSRS